MKVDNDKVGKGKVVAAKRCCATCQTVNPGAFWARVQTKTGRPVSLCRRCWTASLGILRMEDRLAPDIEVVA